MEKRCNEEKQAYEQTKLQYQMEKTSREEIQEQLENEREALDRTQVELGGNSWWWETAVCVKMLYRLKLCIIDITRI